MQLCGIAVLLLCLFFFCNSFNVVKYSSGSHRAKRLLYLSRTIEPHSHRARSQSNTKKALVSGLALLNVYQSTKKPAEAVPLPQADVANLPTVSLPTATATLVNENEPNVLSSFYSGAISRISKELLLHPFDTVRARQQTSNTIVSAFSTSTEKESPSVYSDLYSGLLPALVSGVPAGALFFGVKDSSKRYFKSNGLSKTQATILSVAVANVFYWVLRTPSEVLKTQQQIAGQGSEYSSFHEARKLFSQNSIPEIYKSYGSNIGYALPADVVKFLVYEQLSSSLLKREDDQSKIEGIPAALVGACAGVTAQIITTPLDVARTRIMIPSGKDDETSKEEDAEEENYSGGDSIVMMQEIYEKEGVKGLFAGIVPRATRAVGSGAIQFASYELSQNQFR